MRLKYGSRVQTPFGAGKVCNFGKEIVEEGPFGERVISVLVDGYSAPHLIPADKVISIKDESGAGRPDQDESKGWTRHEWAKRTFVKTGKLPKRGKDKKMLEHIKSERFIGDDIIEVVLWSVGERLIRPTKRPRRTAGGILKKWLSSGYIR